MHAAYNATHDIQIRKTCLLMERSRYVEQWIYGMNDRWNDGEIYGTTYRWNDKTMERWTDGVFGEFGFVFERLAGTVVGWSGVE